MRSRSLLHPASNTYDETWYLTFRPLLNRLPSALLSQMERRSLHLRFWRLATLQTLILDFFDRRIERLTTCRQCTTNSRATTNSKRWRLTASASLWLICGKRLFRNRKWGSWWMISTCRSPIRRQAKVQLLLYSFVCRICKISRSLELDHGQLALLTFVPADPDSTVRWQTISRSGQLVDWSVWQKCPPKMWWKF